MKPSERPGGFTLEFAQSILSDRAQDEREYGAQDWDVNLDWACAIVKVAKQDRVTDAELDTLRWNGVMKCYLMGWCGMTLGIETDGHMHT